MELIISSVSLSHMPPAVRLHRYATLRRIILSRMSHATDCVIPQRFSTTQSTPHCETEGAYIDPLEARCTPSRRAGF